MFNTAIQQIDNPEKVNRSACRTEQRKFRVSSKKGQDNFSANFSTLRPFTSPKGQQKIEETLNTTSKRSNVVDMHTIDVVQNNLQSEYRGEMGSYLKKKLRNTVGKHQQDVLVHQYLNNTIQIGQLGKMSHSTGPLNQFYSQFRPKSRLKVTKGVQNAYVKNTKQHIMRLIQLKRQKQGDFKQLNQSIKFKVRSREQKKHRYLHGHFSVPQVQKQDWDKKWRLSVSSQKNRYRQRLILKNRKDKGGIFSINFDN